MGILGIYARKSKDTDSTSIEQQINAGIEFSTRNDYQYQVFEDVKSGYKISNKNDPFTTRPGIMQLIKEIEKKNIDKVWVWEDSRLSRNHITQFYLNQIFIENNVILFIRDTKFDLNNPRDKMIKGIMEEISEYERHEIVDRITRGVQDSIDNGIQSFGRLYGYKKEGINIDGYINWVPVNSEIEKLKYLFESFLNGEPLKTIVNKISDTYMNKKHSGREKETHIKKWYRFLMKFEYTGNNLTIEGKDVRERFINGDISNLSEISNSGNYVKSLQFPVEIVSIENWIKINERLQLTKNNNISRIRRTNKEFLTGIISCPCGDKYFFYDGRGYKYYKHYPNSECKQIPKSLKIEKTNNLFKMFFFYYYLVYDSTKILIEENKSLLKINQEEIKDKIRIINKENKEIEEQINNFKSIYKTEKDVKKISIIIEKEMELKTELEVNNNEILKLKNEIEEINNKFNKYKLELAYYDYKEIIINFIEKMTNDEKKISISKIINKCQLFNKYILINAESLLFIFSIEMEYIIPETIYNDLKNDDNFRYNFLNQNSLLNENGEYSPEVQKFYDTPNNEILASENFEETIYDMNKRLNVFYKIRYLGDFIIREFFLSDKNDKIIINEKFDKLNIDYDLNKIKKVISFIKDF